MDAWIKGWMQDRSMDRQIKGRIMGWMCRQSACARARLFLFIVTTIGLFLVIVDQSKSIKLSGSAAAVRAGHFLALNAKKCARVRARAVARVW